MGGWTSIASCLGDQNIFSVSLSHDAAFYQNAQDIRDDTLDLKVPSHMLQSQGFLSVMMPQNFDNAKDCFDLYTKMAINLTKRIGKTKYEAILLKNSGHLEQMDRSMTEEWTMASASPLMSKVSAEKKEGSNV